MPAGMTMMSAFWKASFAPSSFGRYPVIFCDICERLYSKDPAFSTYGLGGDVGEIGSNTWGVDNIVEGELIDERAELEEEGQRLNGFVSAIDSLNGWLTT